MVQGALQGVMQELSTSRICLVGCACGHCARPMGRNHRKDNVGAINYFRNKYTFFGNSIVDYSYAKH